MGEGVGSGEADELAGMPGPYHLRRFEVGGETIVSWGPRVMFRFATDDVAMRNLAMVALTDGRVAGKDVAATFEITQSHLSRIRGKVAERGSAALVGAMGRPSKLTAGQVDEMAALAEKGSTEAEIAALMGVSQSTVSRRLARRRSPASKLQPFDFTENDTGDDTTGDDTTGDDTTGDGMGGDDLGGDGDAAAGVGGPRGRGSARLEEAEVSCRYAGAMLLWPFLDRLGAGKILAGLDGGPARRYDTTSIVVSATIGFALGEGSLEAVKHLAPVDAGAVVGLGRFPEVRTLRPRLGAIAERTDALDLQVTFAKAMLATDEHPPEVFFCDDHFVAYTGAAPVAKGYNIRRHIAEPGRDDTVIVDDTWRAICFDSGEPRGLSVSMPEVLERLKNVCGARRVTLGFDRGGSYPKVFSAIRDADMDWVTWRRAPLATPGIEASRRYADIDGKRFAYLLADEIVELRDYGPARQISVVDDGKVIFQVLTSDLATHPVRLIRLLKARWCVENAFKYAEDHHGIHWLCTYRMDLGANTAKVANPARRPAKAGVAAAEAALADLQRRIGQVATDATCRPDTANTELAALTRRITGAEADLTAARARLKPIRAKLPANQLNPDATRAKPRLARRALQMVCRLLAYNAELDLARRLDAYLADADNYRSLTRHLLHLAGTITYTPAAITVTLDHPHPPRLARAVALLIDQINLQPPHIPGDHRPITYTLAQGND